MKVILKQDIAELGKGGELIDVKDGYARNYLIPQGLVFAATTKNMKRLEHERAAIEARIKKERSGSEDLATRIAAITCTIPMRVGENGRLFGSVTSKDLEEAMREEGLLISRKDIQLDDQIKELGNYSVPIKLRQGVVAQLKVWVVAK